jgi:hypothetical protein
MQTYRPTNCMRGPRSSLHFSGLRSAGGKAPILKLKLLENKNNETV